jgi:hypothetical protein
MLMEIAVSFLAQLDERVEGRIGMGTDRTYVQSGNLTEDTSDPEAATPRFYSTSGTFNTIKINALKLDLLCCSIFAYIIDDYDR